MLQCHDVPYFYEYPTSNILEQDIKSLKLFFFSNNNLLLNRFVESKTSEILCIASVLSF